MSELLCSLLSLSAVMSAVIITIVFILRFCGKISASVRYTVWILIMIRFTLSVAPFPTFFEITFNDHAASARDSAYPSDIFSPIYSEEIEHIPFTTDIQTIQPENSITILLPKARSFRQYRRSSR